MVNEQLMNEYEGHKVVITFNKQTLEDYTNHYFKKYPTRKALPLKWLGAKRNGQLPSWNRYINCPSRITQNQWKQDLADYTKYILETQKIKPYMYDRVVLVIKQYHQTKQKADCDNLYGKATIDMCVKWGLLTEDNYSVVRPVILYANYDKDNPRTELVFYPITDEFTQEFVMEVVAYDMKGEK